MKSFYTIIQSELSQNEKEVSELLRELSNMIGIKKSIKEIRKNLSINNCSENDLKVACEFHNILNDYAKSY